MDRKPKRCSKIFALTLAFIYAIVISAIASKNGSALLRDYDIRIIRESEKLDSIKNELERGRKKIDELRQTEGNYLEQLKQLEVNIALAQSYVNQLSEQIDSVAFQVELQQQRLDSATQKLLQRQNLMEQRLRALYMARQPKMYMLLFKLSASSDFLHRIRYFQELNRYDRILLASIDSSKKQIERHKATLKLKQDQLIALKNTRIQQQQQMQTQKNMREEILKQVQSQKQTYIAMVAELEASQKELSGIIQKLRGKRETVRKQLEQTLDISFEKRKGSLIWPVQGKVVQAFGKIVHPVYKTVIFNTGIDIKATAGQNVVCVAPGEVSYIGWMRGYGKLVVVEHGGNYVTIYTHLSEVLVTQNSRVQLGQVIAKVGDTGSLQGAMLHFEIRYATEPLDPLQWLQRQ